VADPEQGETAAAAVEVAFGPLNNSGIHKAMVTIVSPREGKINIDHKGATTDVQHP
jgi:hypothetical protein